MRNEIYIGDGVYASLTDDPTTIKLRAPGTHGKDQEIYLDMDMLKYLVKLYLSKEKENDN